MQNHNIKICRNNTILNLIKKKIFLFKERGITFEQVIALIEKGYVLDLIDHPNRSKYPKQKMYIVDIDNYCYLVPHIIQKD